MCLYPNLIFNPKYKPNKKNGGYPPAVFDERVKYVPIGCGKCMECYKQKANNWRIRLAEESKHNGNWKFVTYTFNTEGLQYIINKIKQTSKKEINGYALDNTICKKAFRYYYENHRKKTGKSIRHWCITELGKGRWEHVHIHAMIWTNQTAEEIRKEWKFGFVHIGYRNQGTINYILKYITKRDIKHPYYEPAIFASSGIGADYINTSKAKESKYNGEETKEYYKAQFGNKIALPIYYRNKLYTEEEREQLWINRINKETRYINGKEIKVNTKEGIEKYMKQLKHAQEKNKQLGYGTDEKNWTEIEYANQMRQLKIEERIKGKKQNSSPEGSNQKG